MKIDRKIIDPTPAARPAEKKPTPSSVRPERPRPADDTKVSLSHEARALADRTAAQSAQKVESLRAALEAGTLSIDPAVIARKLVEES